MALGRPARAARPDGDTGLLSRALALQPTTAAHAADTTGAPDARFVQANLSISAQGVLRGLHYHRRQLDYWVVPRGRAFVALVDVRPVVAGNGTGVVETRELDADETGS